jgi:hypothetical protein
MNFWLESRAKSDLTEFLESWATGTVRVVTAEDHEMLRQLRTCQDTLASTYCEQLELPLGSTYGEAATHVLQMLEAWCERTGGDEE